MNFEEAKRLSLLKWDYAIKRPELNITEEGSAPMFKAHPELKDLRSGCGFCQLYREYRQSGEDCSKCPLSPGKRGTFEDYCCSEFYKYARLSTKRWRKHWATKLRDRIAKSVELK